MIYSNCLGALGKVATLPPTRIHIHCKHSNILKTVMIHCREFTFFIPAAVHMSKPTTRSSTPYQGRPKQNWSFTPFRAGQTAFQNKRLFLLCGSLHWRRGQTVTILGSLQTGLFCLQRQEDSISKWIWQSWLAHRLLRSPWDAMFQCGLASKWATFLPPTSISPTTTGTTIPSAQAVVKCAHMSKFTKRQAE